MADDIQRAAAQVEALWEGKVETICRRVVAEALANYRPGGTYPLEVVVVSPTASTSAPVGHVYVRNPTRVEDVCLYGDDDGLGTATIDVKVIRPTQTVADLASIFGATLPSLAEPFTTVAPSADWQRNVEAGSHLYYYVTTCSGLDILTIAVGVRAIPGASV